MSKVAIRRVAGALVVAALCVVGLAVVVPGLATTASSQTPPTCPTGSTLNPATGQCEQPATATCPPGTTLSGTTCSATLPCPDAPLVILGGTINFPRQVVADPTGLAAATCDVTDVSVPFVGQSLTLSCPAGTTVSTFNAGTPNNLVGTVLGTSGAITCSAPATLACAAGLALSGTTCRAAPAASPTCPAGHQPVPALSGGTRCVVPTRGFALAIGGGPGSSGPPDGAPDDDLWCPGDQVPRVDENGDVVLDQHGFTECVEPGEDAGAPPPPEDVFDSDGFA